MLERSTEARRPRHRTNEQQPCPYCHGTGIATPRIDPEEQLIRAIALFVGARTFNVHELMNFAMVTEGPLRDAIGDMSSIRLGKLLRRIFTEGKNFAGFVLERI